MDELQRQQYLSAMRVSSWAPRLILSGARMSRPYLVDQPDLAEHKLISEMASVGTGLELSREGKEDEIRAILEVPVSVDNDSEVQLSDQIFLAKSINESQPVFCFGFIQTENFLVINEFPITGNKELTPVHQRLLNHIFLALGLGNISISSMELFEWPMIANRQIDQGVQVAKDALQMYLAKRTMQQAMKFVLLMGKTLTSYLSVDGFSQHPIDGEITSEINNESERFSVSFSLNELLMEPENKGVVWQQLQDLRNYLHSYD